MLASILIGTLVAFVLLLLAAVPFAAMRDAKKRHRAHNPRPGAPSEDTTHPLTWLLLALLSLAFAGIGAWHLLHPDELRSGGQFLAVIAGIAYLAIGANGPGIAWLAMAACCLAAAIWHYRAQQR